MLKNIVYILPVLFLLNCSVHKESASIQSNNLSQDSVEYKLIVFEPGFDSWFETNRTPDWYHSHEYYRYWNMVFSIEWNYRFYSFNGKRPYDYAIGYDFSNNYGIQLDHKLYWFFRFMEDKYNMQLNISQHP